MFRFKRFSTGNEIENVIITAKNTPAKNSQLSQKYKNGEELVCTFFEEV